MKKIAVIVGALVLYTIFFTATLNSHNVVDFVYHTDRSFVPIQLSCLIYATFALGALATLFLFSILYIDAVSQIRVFQKKADKLTLITEEDKKEIEVLTNKIEVMEKALRKALDSNDDKTL